MKINVKVELNQANINRLVKAIDPSVKEAVDIINDNIVQAQVVPKSTGELERDAFVNKAEKCIYQVVYTFPYSRRLYWNPQFNFRQDMNPNAQGMWLHPWIDGDHEDEFKNAFAYRLKENCKGLIE